MSAKKILILAAIILIPAGMRLIEHPWNLTPIGAIALFCGAYFRNKSIAILVPLLSMFVGDVGLGLMRGDLGRNTFHMLAPVIYICFAFYVLLGIGVDRFWKRQPKQSERIFAVPTASVCGSVVFFLVTNFGVWLTFNTYAHTFAGLVECYWAGLPYFQRTLAGDMFYTVVLFGGFEILKNSGVVFHTAGLLKTEDAVG